MSAGRARRLGVPARGTRLAAALLASFGAACSASIEVAGHEVARVGDPPAHLVVVERRSERGIERIEESAPEEGQPHDVVVARAETDFYGGASDALGFGYVALSRIARQRGHDHWVILDHRRLRTGTADEPGNDWEIVLGLLDGPGDVDLAARFPGRVHAARTGRVWPADPQATSLPGDARHDALWDVFSGMHFAFRAEGEGC